MVAVIQAVIAVILALAMLRVPACASLTGAVQWAALLVLERAVSFAGPLLFISLHQAIAPQSPRTFRADAARILCLHAD